MAGAGADGKPGTFRDVPLDGVRYWGAGDLAAGPSSGSYPAKGMLIVPASTACVAGVALGLSKDLLQRVASVTLKERRRLVVAVRETPLNGQTLRHLVALDEAGAVVLPASPAFYAGATHIQDLVDFVAGRVLDAAGVPHGLYRRWEGSSVAPAPGTRPRGPGSGPQALLVWPGLRVLSTRWAAAGWWARDRLASSWSCRMCA